MFLWCKSTCNVPSAVNGTDSIKTNIAVIKWNVQLCPADHTTGGKEIQCVYQMT